MSHILHTDTCASIIRDAQPAKTRFAQSQSGLQVSVLSVTGLEIWLLRPKSPLHYRTRFFNFLQCVSLIEVTEPIAHRAAMIVNGLQGHGLKIKLADSIIAATALEQGLPLVTHSIKRFANIPGLTVLDWSVP